MNRLLLLFWLLPGFAGAVTISNAPNGNGSPIQTGDRLPIERGGLDYFVVLDGIAAMPITDTGGYYATDTINAAFQAIGAYMGAPAIDLAADVTGVLPLENGGFGSDVTALTDGVPYIDGGNIIIASLTNGVMGVVDTFPSPITSTEGLADAVGVTGTPDNTTFWRGDGVWATVPTGGLGTGLSSTDDEIQTSTGTFEISGVGGTNNEGFVIDVETTANTVEFIPVNGAVNWDLTAITVALGAINSTTLTATTFTTGEKAASSAVGAGFGEFWTKNTAPTTAWFTDDTDADFQFATLTGTETLTGKTIANGSNTMPLYVEKHAASHTISANECYGGVHYVTSTGTITLPAVASGMSVTVITVGNIAVSVDANAADLIYLDGVALDDGDKITNLSTTGDLAVLTYYDSSGWYAATNDWTDGGP